MAKIGIDFGTSYTTLSRVNPGTGSAEPIRINGKEKIPMRRNVLTHCHPVKLIVAPVRSFLPGVINKAVHAP